MSENFLKDTFIFDSCQERWTKHFIFDS